jgi:hypothetical protein
MPKDDSRKVGGKYMVEGLYTMFNSSGFFTMKPTKDYEKEGGCLKE